MGLRPELSQTRQDMQGNRPDIQETDHVPLQLIPSGETLT